MERRFIVNKRGLLQAVEHRKEELIRLCCELVRIPSENPPGNTVEMAEFLKGLLVARGIKVDVFEPMKGMPNLIASLGDGDGGPSLILNGHMDEFPAGGGWDFPPFCGRVEQGRILGRGSSDMKAGLAVSVFLFTLIRESDLRLPGRLTLSFVSDEETGGTWGTKWLLENLPVLRGDACLIGEAGGTQAVGIGEKGVCWLRLRSRGMSAHAAHGTGVNAIATMSKAIQIVQTLLNLKGSASKELEELIENQRPLAVKEWGPGASKALDHVTANVGTIKGGTKINLVADGCEAELDIRVPIGLTLDQVKRFLDEGFRDEGLGEVESEFIYKVEPNYTRPGERIVKLVRQNSKEIVGKAAIPVLRLGMTDARLFRGMSIPTVVYGPTAYHMGGPNEHIMVEDLISTAKVHAGVLVDYLSEKNETG
jgi:succinyl-diaminopimelate desuccinylase